MMLLFLLLYMQSAKPVFTKHLSNQSPKAELQSDLDVLCSIRGRPKPDVIWQYKGTDLPVRVTVISEPDVVNGKLTTVSRRLVWSKESTLDQHRSTAGVYTCIGRVADKKTEESVNINVQCEFTKHNWYIVSVSF